jgi:hypothetical protein
MKSSKAIMTVVGQAGKIVAPNNEGHGKSKIATSPRHGELLSGFRMTPKSTSYQKLREGWHAPAMARGTFRSRGAPVDRSLVDRPRTFFEPAVEKSQHLDSAEEKKEMI